MQWQNSFLNEVKSENETWDKLDDQAKRVLKQTDGKCQANSSEFDEVIQQLVEMAAGLKRDPDDSTQAEILSAAEALKQFEDVERFTEALHALDQAMERIFELSYSADLDLQEFEQELPEKWEEKKLASEHYAMKSAALTGMTHVMRNALKRHELAEGEQKAVGKDAKPDDGHTRGKQTMREESGAGGSKGMLQGDTARNEPMKGDGAERGHSGAHEQDKDITQSHRSLPMDSQEDEVDALKRNHPPGAKHPDSEPSSIQGPKAKASIGEIKASSSKSGTARFKTKSAQAGATRRD